jgi:hypothetical protein
VIRRVLAGLALIPATLAAQGEVGYPPSQSPFRDIDTRLRLGLYVSSYAAAKDPAGVLPKSGMLFGSRLDVHVGGPGDIAFRVGLMPTERTELDPARAESERVVGTRDINLVFADVGLVFHLTGNKTWHRIAPTVHASVGIVSDFEKADAGGYEHGTTFAFGYGTGIRYIPPATRFSFRAELGSYLYSTSYPDTYFRRAGDGTSVLSTGTQRNSWRNNWTVTLGTSYRLFR